MPNALPEGVSNFIDYTISGFVATAQQLWGRLNSSATSAQVVQSSEAVSASTTPKDQVIRSMPQGSLASLQQIQLNKATAFHYSAERNEAIGRAMKEAISIHPKILSDPTVIKYIGFDVHQHQAKYLVRLNRKNPQTSAIEKEARLITVPTSQGDSEKTRFSALRAAWIQRVEERAHLQSDPKKRQIVLDNLTRIPSMRAVIYDSENFGAQFVNGVHRDDLKQESRGDCYFLAPLSATAQVKPSLFEDKNFLRLIKRTPEGAFYRVAFFKREKLLNGDYRLVRDEPIEVLVKSDDLRGENGGVRSNDKREEYGRALELAWAKQRQRNQPRKGEEALQAIYSDHPRLFEKKQTDSQGNVTYEVTYFKSENIKKDCQSVAAQLPSSMTVRVTMSETEDPEKLDQVSDPFQGLRREAFKALQEETFKQYPQVAEEVFLNGGNEQEAVEALWGEKANVYPINPKARKDHLTFKELKEKLVAASKEKKAILIGTYERSKEPWRAFSHYGIVFGHAYSIHDVKEHQGETYALVRNPWGKSSKHSAHSPQSGPTLTATEERKGYFWMSLVQLRWAFDDLTISS